MDSLPFLTNTSARLETSRLGTLCATKTIVRQKHVPLQGTLPAARDVPRRLGKGNLRRLRDTQPAPAVDRSPAGRTAALADQGKQTATKPGCVPAACFFVPGFRIRTRAASSRCNLVLLFFTILNAHLRDAVRATLTTADEHKSRNSFAEAADRRYCVLRDWRVLLMFSSRSRTFFLTRRFSLVLPFLWFGSLLYPGVMHIQSRGRRRRPDKFWAVQRPRCHLRSRHLPASK